MDRLIELSAQLNGVLTQLHEEAARRDLRQLNPPLTWLDEANGWFKYEMVRLNALERDPVPFTYIPVDPAEVAPGRGVKRPACATRSRRLPR
jgi:hypothetical protein